MSWRRFIPLAPLLFASCTEWRGVTVSLENGDTKRLDAVMVHVTGRGYPIGSLGPGQRESVLVRPTSESHVEVAHAARSERLVVDSYFEPGYRQHIEARITADSVLWVQVTEPY
jgi:hypothetical protein